MMRLREHEAYRFLEHRRTGSSSSRRSSPRRSVDDHRSDSPRKEEVRGTFDTSKELAADTLHRT